MLCNGKRYPASSAIDVIQPLLRRKQTGQMNQSGKIYQKRKLHWVIGALEERSLKKKAALEHEKNHYLSRQCNMP